MSLRHLMLTASLAALAVVPAHAQQTPAKPEAAAAKKPSDDAVTAPVAEDAQPKRGRVTVGGKVVNYTVTPGTLTIRNDDGEPIASMFYVAYVADAPKGAAPRPITFAFNGGPGSSSMWLHMGSIGPVHVRTPAMTTQANAPFEIGENHETLLDKTDIVFLDAIGTGLSRPIGKGKGSDFYGVDQDIDAFAKAILRYSTKYGRWNSPKFLFGESYGTLRGAGLVNALQDRGMQMNGVILLSSILNYGVRQPGYDQIHLTYLPTYAATAWYHNRLANRPEKLEPFLDEVRKWTVGAYASALAKGSDISADEAKAVARQMSAYTGLSEQFILDADLRVELSRFRKELMRDGRRTVGRLDSRFQGIDVDAAGEGPEYDAADAAISGAYIGALNEYLFNRLGYKSELHYRPNFYSEIGGGKWDQKHRHPSGRGTMGLADTALDLSVAMRENPNLKVLSLNGYYDMATPFFGAEYDLKHMQIDPALQKNLSFRYYQSGHMVYITDEVRKQFQKDFGSFIDTASKP